ncbi:MAG: ribonuclease Z [Clostridia bacterium]|nr:ribonuclease Z [Clostridia bacterium]
MKVTVVGTGCTWVTRNNTSFILDDKMLFDIPSGNYKEIIKSIDIFNLSAVFISHLHSDHFGDFYVIASRYIREMKKLGRTEKLRVYGLKGLDEYVINLNKMIFCAEDETSMELLKGCIEFIEVEDGSEFIESGYKVKAYRMTHGKMECYGYSFTDEKGKTISFTADTCICDAVDNMLSVSDVSFVDVASVDDNIRHHISYNQFLGLMKKFPNCKMYPVHTNYASQKIIEENNTNPLFDGIVLNV